MRKLLSGREVSSINTLPDAEKVMVIEFVPADREELTLMVQLGGKRPNVFILDGEGAIIGALRDLGNELKTGQKYVPPVAAALTGVVRETGDRSLSEVLDAANREDEAEADLETLAQAARRKITADIAKRRKLIKNLDGDLAAQGNADEWKRYGDLILANISNIRREGDKLIVTDYFDPEQRELAISVDNDLSPTDAAEFYFKKYTKARNGAAEIAKRLTIVNTEINKLEAKRSEIEAAIETQDSEYLSRLSPSKKQEAPQQKRKDKTDEFKGARRFVSSDGFEVLVGKKARDNDHLTFRIAKSLDLWLHAADYPGSHVVVRNPNRKEIPIQTLTEAAQLAAFYSDARAQSKAAVRYTQKKFVNKPRRAAPGLVSLASFKTILVEPHVAVKPRTADEV
jgi:predicted ribosome quality control (RQC) complex YloA/Tae2 family protein